MNNRRKLLVALGASTLTAPLAPFAQQPAKVWRVGFLAQRSRPDSLDADIYGAFPLGMRELGYVEGKNLEIQWRYAEGKVERLPGLAAELVQLKVDVLVAAETPAIRAAQKTTATMVREKSGAVIVQPEGLFIQLRGQIAKLAVQNRLPSIMTFWGYAGWRINELRA